MRADNSGNCFLPPISGVVKVRGGAQPPGIIVGPLLQYLAFVKNSKFVPYQNYIFFRTKIIFPKFFPWHNLGSHSPLPYSSPKKTNHSHKLLFAEQVWNVRIILIFFFRIIRLESVFGENIERA